MADYARNIKQTQVLHVLKLGTFAPRYDPESLADLFLNLSCRKGMNDLCGKLQSIDWRDYQV